MFIDESIHPPTPLPEEYERDETQLDLAARKIQQFFRRHISVVKTEVSL